MGQKIQFSSESILFETKSKVGINEMYSNCQRQLQTSDQGFHAISALINAASPKK